MLVGHRRRGDEMAAIVADDAMAGCDRRQTPQRDRRDQLREILQRLEHFAFDFDLVVREVEAIELFPQSAGQ